MKLINGRTTQQHIPVFVFWVFLVAKGVCSVWETLVHMWKSRVVEKNVQHITLCLDKLM